MESVGELPLSTLPSVVVTSRYLRIERGKRFHSTSPLCCHCNWKNGHTSNSRFRGVCFSLWLFGTSVFHLRGQRFSRLKLLLEMCAHFRRFEIKQRAA